MLVYAQDFKALNKVSQRDTLPEGKSIVYGNFMQRLGFRSIKSIYIHNWKIPLTI